MSKFELATCAILLLIIKVHNLVFLKSWTHNPKDMGSVPQTSSGSGS